jgi:hypothetical protein
MIDELLPLLTLFTDQDQFVNQQGGNLHGATKSIFSLLAGYRSHEARHLLINKLKEELSMAKEVEEELIRYVLHILLLSLLRYQIFTRFVFLYWFKRITASTSANLINASRFDHPV